MTFNKAFGFYHEVHVIIMKYKAQKCKPYKKGVEKYYYLEISNTPTFNLGRLQTTKTITIAQHIFTNAISRFLNKNHALEMILYKGPSN